MDSTPVLAACSPTTPTISSSNSGIHTNLALNDSNSCGTSNERSPLVRRPASKGNCPSSRIIRVPIVRRRVQVHDDEESEVVDSLERLAVEKRGP